MKTRSLIIILTVMTVFYACKKSETSQPTPVITGEKVKVSVRLNGEIITSQAPFPGTRLSGKDNHVTAKTIEDSTIYAVDVRSLSGELYAQGLFNVSDSIMLEIPKGVGYRINVAVVKRGSSVGLWWGIMSPGYEYFLPPFNRMLKNQMEYNTDVQNSPNALDYGFLDTLSNIPVRADLMQVDEDVYYYSELDTYYGTTDYTAADTASSINISLKRIGFGIQYNLINFTGGTLIADYSGAMKTKYISYSNLTDNLGIYTADAYRWSDALYSNEQFHLTLKWQKDDGTVVTLGDRYLSPARNSLTTVNVTLPDPNTLKAVIQLTDTTWAGNNNIDF